MILGETSINHKTYTIVMLVHAPNSYVHHIMLYLLYIYVKHNVNSSSSIWKLF